MTTKKLPHTKIGGFVEASQNCVQTEKADLARGEGWTDEFIRQSCGSWEGELLIRPEQPDYDKRETLS